MHEAQQELAFATNPDLLWNRTNENSNNVTEGVKAWQAHLYNEGGMQVLSLPSILSCAIVSKLCNQSSVVPSALQSCHQSSVVPSTLQLCHQS